MHRNHLVWAEIESITARYQMTDSDGKTTPDTEKQIIARRSLLALRNFFLKNNLLADKKQTLETRILKEISILMISQRRALNSLSEKYHLG